MLAGRLAGQQIVNARTSQRYGTDSQNSGILLPSTSLFSLSTCVQLRFVIHNNVFASLRDSHSVYCKQWQRCCQTGQPVFFFVTYNVLIICTYRYIRHINFVQRSTIQQRNSYLHIYFSSNFWNKKSCYYHLNIIHVSLKIMSKVDIL